MIRDAIALVLVALTALVSLAGLIAELGGALFGWSDRSVELFALSYEANVPTWYASSLLVLASAALAVCAERARIDRGPWAGLAALFAIASLDEAIELHEHLGALVAGRGIFYFGWVIPGAAIVAIIGALFMRFLFSLPAIDRRRFVVAGALFVGGALGMELPLGWWTEHAGDDNLVYGLIDWVEETLELAGTTTFVLALRARLARAPELA